MADGLVAEGEDSSAVYYSDEEDDLDAFSDAQLGGEDGGRTCAETAARSWNS